jgi:hypothetical protein
MEMGIFTWMYLFGMVASQHPLRIGLTHSPLKTSVPDVFAFLLFASLQEHSLRSFVYSTHLYFEASFKSSFIS